MKFEKWFKPGITDKEKEIVENALEKTVFKDNGSADERPLTPEEMAVFKQMTKGDDATFGRIQHSGFLGERQSETAEKLNQEYQQFKNLFEQLEASQDLSAASSEFTQHPTERSRRIEKSLMESYKKITALEAKLQEEAREFENLN